MLISVYMHIYGTGTYLRLYRVCTTYVRITSKQPSLFRTHLVLHTKNILQNAKWYDRQAISIQHVIIVVICYEPHVASQGMAASSA